SQLLIFGNLKSHCRSSVRPNYHGFVQFLDRGCVIFRSVIDACTRPLIKSQIQMINSTPPEPVSFRDLVREKLTNWFYGSGDFTLILADSALSEARFGIEAPINAASDWWWYRYCCERSGRDEAKGRWRSFEFQEEISGKTARLQVSRAFDARAWTV